MKIKIHKNSFIILVVILSLVSSSLILITSTKPPAPKDTLKPTSEKSAIGNTQEYNAIKKIADESGVEAAWQNVIDTYGKDNSKQLEAHDYAHYVGQLIFEKKGLIGITLCTADFAFGCYHGLLDRAFRTDLSSLQDAEKACQQVGKSGSGPYASCIHGIGHGIASYFKNTDLKEALKTCEKLPEGATQFCYDGVFMEFSRDALDTFYKASDPLYPCNTVEPKYTYPCGRNQPAVLMNRFQKSYDDVAKACQKSSVRDLKIACYTALGFQTVYLSEGNAEKIISKCESMHDKEFEYQCKSAAAGELIFQDMQDWQENSSLICDSLSGTDKEACHTYITSIQKNYKRT